MRIRQWERHRATEPRQWRSAAPRALAIAVLLLSAPTITKAAAIAYVDRIDFSVSSDVSNNFDIRVKGGSSGSVGYASGDDGGFGSGGFFRTATGAPGSGNTTAAFYTPITNFVDFVLDYDFRLKTSDRGSTGIYFRGHGNLGLLAVVGLDESAVSGADRVRWFSHATRNDLGAGTLRNADSADTALTGNDSWYHVRLTVQTLSGGDLQATLNLYDSQVLFNSQTLLMTAAHTFPASQVSGAGGSLAIRPTSNNIDGTARYSDFDNFAVYAVGHAPTALIAPEPSSLILTGFAAALLLLGVRRMKRC